MSRFVPFFDKGVSPRVMNCIPPSGQNDPTRVSGQSSLGGTTEKPFIKILLITEQENSVSPL